MAGIPGIKGNQSAARKITLKEMKDDVIRGLQKHQVRDKFVSGQYYSKTSSVRSFNDYWRDMLDLFAEEFEKNREDLKSKFLARYLYLYELAVQKNNLKDARAILDSIVKLTGADEPIRQEIDLTGGFSIDFGLDNIVKDE